MRVNPRDAGLHPRKLGLKHVTRVTRGAVSSRALLCIPLIAQRVGRYRGAYERELKRVVPHRSQEVTRDWSDMCSRHGAGGARGGGSQPKVFQADGRAPSSKTP